MLERSWRKLRSKGELFVGLDMEDDLPGDAAQNPMFFDGRPPDWAVALPGWGSTRMIVNGAFGTSFDAGLLAALGWALCWSASSRSCSDVLSHHATERAAPDPECRALVASSQMEAGENEQPA